jgi:hypothetical protein
MYDKGGHSDYSDDDREKNKEDDEKLLKNMQFLFNQEVKGPLDRKTTLVDIELAAEAIDEVQIDMGRVGSLGSEPSSDEEEIQNPYLENEEKQRTHTFIDYAQFSYFPETIQEV